MNTVEFLKSLLTPETLALTVAALPAAVDLAMERNPSSRRRAKMLMAVASAGWLAGLVTIGSGEVRERNVILEQGARHAAVTNQLSELLITRTEDLRFTSNRLTLTSQQLTEASNQMHRANQRLVTIGDKLVAATNDLARMTDQYFSLSNQLNTLTNQGAITTNLIRETAGENRRMAHQLRALRGVLEGLHGRMGPLVLTNGIPPEQSGQGQAASEQDPIHTDEDSIPGADAASREELLTLSRSIQKLAQTFRQLEWQTSRQIQLHAGILDPLALAANQLLHSTSLTSIHQMDEKLFQRITEALRQVERYHDELRAISPCSLGQRPSPPVIRVVEPLE